MDRVWHMGGRSDRVNCARPEIADIGARPAQTIIVNIEPHIGTCESMTTRAG
jgi:hypothetical protein